MSEVTTSAGSRVPAKDVILSGLVLCVPMLAALTVPDALGEYGALLWLLALIPAFLMAYHRGWRGATTALALGMVSLSLTQAVATSLSLQVPDLLLGIVVAYIGITLGIGGMAERMHRDRDAVETMAYTDGLTRLPNRRHVTLFLENECAAAGRGRLTSAVLFDLDHFKPYNDKYGHAAGDEALRVFGHVLSQTTRRMNLSGRIGGEEFLTVLAETDAEGAMIFAERVRTLLRAHELGDPPLSVSAGVATYHSGMRSSDELLAAADHALYQAKNSGRDRVKLFGRAIVEPSDSPLHSSAAGEDPNLEDPGDYYDVEESPPALTLPPHDALGFGRGRSVLVVEHEDPVRESIVEYLKRGGFAVHGASGEAQAIEKLATEFDIVIAAYPLPSEQGHALVSTVKSRWPATQVVALTMDDDPTAVAEALRAGADRLVPKPFDLTDLRVELETALRRRDRVASARMEARMLSLDSDERSSLTWAQLRVGLQGLLAAAEIHDPYTRGHGVRTAKFAVTLARNAGLAGANLEALQDGALFHDLGMLSVPTEILRKKGPLEGTDWISVRAHPKAGLSIVETLVSAECTLAAITWHHERWDGTGYPDKLAGEAIPRAARITAIADALSAMVSGRSYRGALTWEEAVSEIQNGFGAAFDPGLERVLEASLDEIHTSHRV